MARKKEWTRLDGELYLNLSTGDVELRYGEGGWFKKNINNIKKTKLFKQILDTYGKKEGLRIRKAAARAIVKSISYK